MSAVDEDVEAAVRYYSFVPATITDIHHVFPCFSLACVLLFLPDLLRPLNDSGSPDKRSTPPWGLLFSNQTPNIESQNKYCMEFYRLDLLIETYHLCLFRRDTARTLALMTIVLEYVTSI